MDKVLIALGGFLLWKSINNEAGEVVETGDKVLKTEGFLGMLLIFAILFSFAQYNKGLVWIPASLSVIIALGFWTNK